MGGYLLKSALESTQGLILISSCPLFCPLFYPLFGGLLNCSSITSPAGERVVRVV